MGLTKEQAQSLLGVTNDSPSYLVRKRYKKLAHRYYPDRNPHRREYALEKFQKVLEAYVRLQIEPDDCDQMKIKHLLMEIYSFHKDVSAEHCDYFSDDSDGADVDNVVSYEASPESPFDSNSGPYCSLLRDFTLRSYMSGGQRSKFFHYSPPRKPYISEEDRKIASQNAEELLKNVEEEKKKDDIRKHRNKKKKEAKKKKKDRTVTGGDTKTDRGHVSDGSNDSQEEDSSLTIDSAFFSRVTSKVSGSSIVVLDDKLITEDTAIEQEQRDSSDDDDGDDLNGKMVALKVDNNISKKKPSVIEGDELPVKGDSSAWHGNSSGSGGGTYSRSYYQSELPPRLQKKLHDTKTSSSITRKPPKQQRIKRKDDYVTGKKWDFNTGKQSSEPRAQQVSHQREETVFDKSRRFAVQGNKAAKDGRFEEAIVGFTKAIELYPKDERYFGNRSFCYEHMREYEKALEDGQTAITLKGDWPKGHFRKGKALIGLNNYKGAELALQKAVGLDPNYHDAAEELKNVMEHLNSTVETTPSDEPPVVYFDDSNIPLTDDNEGAVANHTQSNNIYNDDHHDDHHGDRHNDHHGDTSHMIYFDSDIVEDANIQKTLTIDINSPPAEESPLIDQSLSSVRSEVECSEAISLSDEHEVVNNHESTNDDNDSTVEWKNTKESDTLWVGNVDPVRINDQLLTDTFQTCGQVLKVHILKTRFCAFVRFDSPESAEKAINKYQNSCVAGCHLMIRYPDHPKSISASPKQKFKNTKISECLYWRGYGCVYGDRCRYLHIKKNKGIDVKQRKPKNYKQQQ